MKIINKRNVKLIYFVIINYLGDNKMHKQEETNMNQLNKETKVT